MERQKSSPLSPRRVKYEALPPGSPNPKSRLRTSLNKHIPPRSRDQIVKVCNQLVASCRLLTVHSNTGMHKLRLTHLSRTNLFLCVQAFVVGVFLLLLGLLFYALHSMTAERVCIPSWASYPPGSHLKIAIVTMTDSQLQSRKAHNQVRGA